MILVPTSGSAPGSSEAAMDEAIAFLRQFVDKELEATRAAWSDPDDERASEKIREVDLLFADGIDSEISRNPGDDLGRHQSQLARLMARHIFWVKEFPEGLFWACLSGTDSISPRTPVGYFRSYFFRNT